MRHYIGVLSALVPTLFLMSSAFAQAPGEPPKVYAGNLGGGLALTGGNTHTKNFNLTAGLVRDPKTKNVVKGTAAFLRGDQNDVLNLDRTSFNIRDEYTLSGRTFVFGQLDYLRDQFKQIVFLWVPAAGVGYKLINTDSTQFILDTAAGGLVEKNPGLDSSKSGSLVPGQRFQRKLSPTATFIESLSAIFKTKDFNDSLTNFSVGLTTRVAGNLELKVELIDSYKNKPANPQLKKNDTAFVTAFIVKY
jgi:putative salt-induced outer membrane protein